MRREEEEEKKNTINSSATAHASRSDQFLTKTQPIYEFLIIVLLSFLKIVSNYLSYLKCRCAGEILLPMLLCMFSFPSGVTSPPVPIYTPF